MTSDYVVDASVAMAWCFLDEATTATRTLYQELSKVTLTVPGWWYIELTNVLYLAEKKGRIPADRVAEFTLFVNGLQLEVDDLAPARAFSDLLPLCRLHGLTSYDAMYLELAHRRNLPLATLDELLRKAAKKIGVKLLGK
jgi:predicted nucleic acid-binding protein